MTFIQFEKDGMFYNVDHITAINRVDKKIVIHVLEHVAGIMYMFDTEENAIKAFNRFYDLISAKSFGLFSIWI